MTEFGYIQTQRHFREVRNAWRGPETWNEILNYPPHVLVDERFKDEFRKACRWYFPVEFRPLSLDTHYARLDRWPWAKFKSAWRDYWYGVLRHFVAIGALHPCAPESGRATWRDLRLGPKCYKEELA